MNDYKKIDAALTLFGYPTVSDKAFPSWRDLVETLQLKHFTYDELTTKFKNANRCKQPIPLEQYWPHSALCLVIAERCRAVGEKPIWIKYAYRNSDFNLLVGGARNSDHTKFALDLVFQGDSTLAFKARDKALDCVIEPLYTLALVELSYGVGTAEPMIHVGVFCGRGHRRWRYESGGAVGF